MWLDAGCGTHILPAWRTEAERALVDTARLTMGRNVDEPSRRDHVSLKRRFVAHLEPRPLGSESVHLVTCNMVVEHLGRPLEVFYRLRRWI